MHYSRTARFYHLLETVFVGGSLKAARIAHLADLPAPKRALLVGEGNGTFLLEFAKRFPRCKITVIDESIEMIRVARKRLAAAGLDEATIEFIPADIRTISLLDGYYDLIATLFFFDNFKDCDVEKMVLSLEQSSTAEARWLLADYYIPEHGWRALRARVWLRVLYTFFGVLAAVPTRNLPKTEAHLRETTFKPLKRKTFCGELLHSTCYTRS